MTCSVRCFAHAGILTGYVLPGSGQYSSDSVGSLKQPYIAKQLLTADTGAPVSSTTALTDSKDARMLLIQVDPGKIIAVEFNPPERTPIVASASSLHVSGEFSCVIGRNWTVSVLEIATS